MNEINKINPTLFLAAAAFAVGRERTNGVFVEPARGGGLLYTAINGGCLLHAYDAGAEMQGPERIIKVPDKFLPGWWESAFLHHSEAGILSTVGCPNWQYLISAPEIDGEFMNYRELLAESEFPSRGEAQYNWEQMAKFTQIAKKAGWGVPCLRSNGRRSARVTFTGGPPAIGIVAPIKVGMHKVPFIPTSIGEMK